MTHPFKQGDKVYHHRHGWGEVNTATHHAFTVVVDFSDGLRHFLGESVDSLSFTEYTLEKGGWSWERPTPEPEIGDMVWAWDNEEGFTYGKLEEIDYECQYPFDINNNSVYVYTSLTPPPHAIEVMREVLK